MGRAVQSSLPMSFLLKFLEMVGSQNRSRRLLLQIALLLSVVTAIVDRRRRNKLRGLILRGAAASIRPDRLPLPPGPRGWPILGIMPSLAGGNPQQVIADMSKTYGPVVSFRLGSHLTVVLNDYAAIREAFVRSADKFSDRPSLTMFEEVHQGGAGVVLAKYDSNWKEIRRFALKTFRNLGMGKAAMETKICEEARHLAHSFLEQGGRPFRSADFTNLAVANMINNLVFGARNDYRDPLFLKVVADMFVLFHQFGVGVVNFLPWTKYLPGSGYRDMRDIPKFMEDKWYRPHVEEHLKSFNANNIRDFVDAFLLEHYLNDESPYARDDRAILGAIGNLYGAGLDTTAVALNWVVLMMTKHPEVQARVQQEMDEVVGRHRMPRWSDRLQLHYVTAVLEEVMRWSSGGPFGVPHSPIEDTEFRGYFIPKEAVVIGNLHALLHNPDVFPDPTAFRPERFLDSDGKFVKHEQMAQFGIGRRGCIGEQLARMEIYIIVTHTLHRFNLRAPDGNPDSISTDSYLGLSKNPLPFKLCALRRTDTYDLEIDMDMLSDISDDNNNNNNSNGESKAL